MSESSQPPAKAFQRRRWKILLVSANRCTVPEPVFPLGLAHLSRVLAETGHEVDWCDLLVAGQGFEEILRTSNPELVGISLRNIDDVIIRKQETFIGEVASLVRTVHETLGCPVVLGGSGFSILPRELLDLTGAEFGIVGEGEVAFPALITALESRSAYQSVPGLVFRREAEIALNTRARTVSQGQPALADVRPQVATYYLQHGGILNLQTQRGCAHRCCYCTYPLIEGTRHRRRSAAAVLTEFDQLERLGARYAFIVDSVFNSSEQHVVDVCEALVRQGSRMRWGCFLRPQGLNRPMMQLMTRAGLSHIEFGSDSFCDEVLQAYQKDLTFDDIRHSTELACQEGIDFCHFLIAGGPGETAATLEIGFRNSQALHGAIILAVPGMRIYPATALFERALAEGRLSPGVNLVQPRYYLAPGLTLDQVLSTLKGFAEKSPNWIVGDFDPAYDPLVARLRKRGVTGPLWSYFAAAQRLRLWPAAPA